MLINPKFARGQSVVVTQNILHPNETHFVGMTGSVVSVANPTDPCEPHVYKVDLDGTGTLLTFWEDELKAA